jgi:phosphoribosylformylglycinamidine (FGAM) synthase-like enzyme
LSQDAIATAALLVLLAGVARPHLGAAVVVTTPPGRMTVATAIAMETETAVVTVTAPAAPILAIGTVMRRTTAMIATVGKTVRMEMTANLWTALRQRTTTLTCLSSNRFALV